MEIQIKGWYKISDKPVRYSLGLLDRYNLVNDIEAVVREVEGGVWEWKASSFLSLIPYGEGIEVSRELAQRAAEKFLDQESITGK
jgi:hypothetical protein